MADPAVSPSAPAAAPAPSASPAPAPSTPVASPTSAAPAPASPAAATKPADTPGSPPAKIDVKAGLMEAAKAALKQTREGKPSPQGQEKPGAPNGADPKAALQNGHDPEAAAAAAAAEAEDETKPPPFNDHPRWKKLTRDFETATKQVKELSPRAEQYDKIQSYMRTFDLSNDEVASAYDIMAKLKHNPQLAFQALKPIWDDLMVRVGEVLPDDLAKRVQDGFLDDESAREIARARKAAETATSEAQRSAEEVGKTNATVTLRNIHSAVARWDQFQTSKNPDFPRLKPLIESAARSLMAVHGQAKTPEQAIQVLEAAMKQVLGQIKPFQAPGPNGSTPKQPVGGTPSPGSAVVEPKSIREAAIQGLKGQYRFNA